MSPQLKFHKPEERKPESSDATLAAIKRLEASKDPKTAALVRELLVQLTRSNPPHGIPMTFKVSPEGGILELRLGDEKDEKPRTPEKPKPVASDKAEGPRFQLHFDKKKPLGSPGSGVQLQFEGNSPKPEKNARGVVVVGEMHMKLAGPGPSTLKMSADGKTAAVVSDDGTVTIFDVASGKELMKFPGKK
ncbi:MAG TPA: hypothetical protein VN641_07835 [Urbifossiella sp.]|nr:hypothetical protein [Urbifossiella sp.]